MKIFPARRLNSHDITSSLDLINSRPIPPEAFRVLFIGNSLTIHGRAEKVWDIVCGMAASSAEKDYLHLVTAGLQQLMPRPVEAFYDNGGDGKIRSMLEYLLLRKLSPDLVIIQGGENDELNDKFREYYPQLLDYYPVPRIVLGDWRSNAKSDYVEGLCAMRDIPFVNLVDIYSDPAMSGNGGPYGHSGVATHPNDAGMSAIAERVLERIELSEDPRLKGKYPL